MRFLALMSVMLLLGGCADPQLRRDLFGYDPASEDFWPATRAADVLGTTPGGRDSCAVTTGRIVTTTGVEDEYRYHDCRNSDGPTDSPQRYGSPGPDQAPIAPRHPENIPYHPTRDLNNIPPQQLPRR